MKIKNIFVTLCIIFLLNFPSYASFDREYDFRPRCNPLKTMVTGFILLLNPNPVESSVRHKFPTVPTPPPVMNRYMTPSVIPNKSRKTRTVHPTVDNTYFWENG